MTLLGTFGLFLMLLVCKLAPVADAPQATGWHGVRAALAHGALDGISAIGWLFDRFPVTGRAAADRVIARRVARSIGNSFSPKV